MARVFDLTTIDPSEFIEFRDSWMKESGLESVGADRLFETAGLSELVEYEVSELKEYANLIGLNVAERKRLIKGIIKLNGGEADAPLTPAVENDAADDACSAASTPEATLEISTSSPCLIATTTGTPQSSKPKPVPRPKLKESHSNSSAASNSSKKHSRKKSNNGTKTPKSSNESKSSKHERQKSGATKRDKSKQRRTKSRSKKSLSPKPRSRKNSKDIDDDNTSDAPMYDPTGRSTPVSASSPPKDAFHAFDKDNKAKDLLTQINEALQQLSMDANATKDDIRRTFMDFRQKLTEREIKLLHDVDTTVDKKTRLLQTQMEYVTDNPGSGDLACDPSMSLQIEKEPILRSLITAGWVLGATSDNKEEQEMQDRERRRREYTRQQYLTVERLKQIFIYEKDCTAKREDSVRLTSEIQDEIAEINIRTAKCEAELAEARPLLEQAKKLVSSIGKKQLDEIRALKKPPAVVELVMSAVAVILGNKIKSWKDIQKCLASRDFIPSVLDFDTMKLKKKVREECKKYIKHQDFNEERANKASKVAGPLVKWVKSQVKYSELLDVVRPMQKEIKLLRKKLDKKQKQLQMCIDVVNELELKISKARTEINDRVENMIKFQDECMFDGDVGGDYTVAKAIEVELELYKQISR
eukprot:CAMPEP_0197073212 /NCGR_PEP_ID=MMETSP1384-20130603/210492_1 /TAXON_ID=29189 /ORGANISM="Ammonia sp." /LENGTH=642 /DNA_ID=CAMNT_0042512045 /DNA_START=104 /DNA_END=2032 /DNA_ORIENTATION=+